MRGALTTRTIAGAAAMIAAALVLISALGFGAARLAMSRLGPPPIDAAAPLSTTVLDREGRLLRAFTTVDGRWRLPVEPVGGRSALPRHAVRVRGPPLHVARRRRCGRHRPRRGSGRHPSPPRLRRLDADHADRAPSRRPPRPHRPRQAQANGARVADRTAAVEGRDPAALSASRAVRRQHRGRARGLARLLRQGAGAVVARRGGAARRAAAIARGATARSSCRRSPPRARPRARRRGCRRCRLGCRSGARQG